MASAAVSILNSYFKSQQDVAESDEKHCEHAEWLLKDNRFAYSKAKKDEPKVSCVLYSKHLLIATIEMVRCLSWSPCCDDILNTL